MRITKALIIAILVLVGFIDGKEKKFEATSWVLVRPKFLFEWGRATEYQIFNFNKIVASVPFDSVVYIEEVEK